jgi:hypothetical protein
MYVLNLIFMFAITNSHGIDSSGSSLSSSILAFCCSLSCYDRKKDTLPNVTHLDHYSIHFSLQEVGSSSASTTLCLQDGKLPVWPVSQTWIDVWTNFPTGKR